MIEAAKAMNEIERPAFRKNKALKPSTDSWGKVFTPLVLAVLLAASCSEGKYIQPFDVNALQEFVTDSESDDLGDMVDTSVFDSIGANRPKHIQGKIGQVTILIELEPTEAICRDNFNDLKSGMAHRVRWEKGGEYLGRSYCQSFIMQNRADSEGGSALMPYYTACSLFSYKRVLVTMFEQSMNPENSKSFDAAKSLFSAMKRKQSG